MNIYLVGGAVRDKLLGYPYHEKDWVVVGATAQQLLDQGYQPVGKDFPVFLHPTTKEEYALARTERKTGGGYTGFECFADPSVTLEEDLQRRDLTINAIAEDEQGHIIDPYGGQADLKNKLLRHTSAAFTEDPVRVLRIARFHARYAHLGFSIADSTKILMREIAAQGELNTLVAERVWKELERALSEKNPSHFFISLDESDALIKLIPKLAPIEKTLTEAVYQQIDYAACNGLNTKIIFSLLLANTSKENCTAICEHIKAPNEYRELAEATCQYAQDYLPITRDNLSHSTPADNIAENILTLLKNLDAFRRPQRFEDFLLACQIIHRHPEQEQEQEPTLLLQQSLMACKSIDAKKLADQGLKGQAIALALQEKRIEAIKKLLLSKQSSKPEGSL